MWYHVMYILMGLALVCMGYQVAITISIALGVGFAISGVAASTFFLIRCKTRCKNCGKFPEEHDET